MPLFGFALRHMHRRWRSNLTLLIGLTLTAALLAGLPGYAAAIAARELDQNLDEAHPAERNLLITGTRYTFNEGLYERLQDRLGELLKDRLVIRHARLSADPPPQAERTHHTPISVLDVYSFDRLAARVRLVEGRFPTQIRVREAEPQRPAPVEAVISARVAKETGYGVGQRLTASKEFHRLDIVGVVEPLDPQDDLWGADLSAFYLATDSSDTNADALALPLIVASTSMRSNFGLVPIFRHEVHWRIILEHDLISVDNAQALHSDLINAQTQFATVRATTSTGLVQILADYMARLSRTRTTLLLLTAQSFIFVLYTLTVITSFVLDRSQVELATLSGRGASAWQVTRVYALEYSILALPAALLLGPGLAQGVMRLWAMASGAVVPSRLPSESWLLSGVAIGLGWLALVLPVYPAARRNVLDWQEMRARPARLSVAQRHYLDLFLLVSGALLYWQLDQSGSFVRLVSPGRTTQRMGDAQMADPLLLIGPTLLLVAIAMIFLRLFPFLLRLIAWIFQPWRGLTLPLGLNRLARDPLKPSRVVLLIGLASGLTLFTSTFGVSLSHSQEEIAHYQAGADLRISIEQDAGIPANALAYQPGVRTAAQVVRCFVRTEQGQTLQLLAVEPDAFAQVARFPASLTDLRIPVVMASIAKIGTVQPGSANSASSADALPAVVSHSALPDEGAIGDLLYLNLAGQRHPLSVQGTINNFPTLSGPFAIVSLPELLARMGADILGEGMSGTHEIWLAIDPAQHQGLIQRLTSSQRILDDAQARLHALQSDALAQGTRGAFQINTLTLALLSVAAFMLVSLFAAQGRVIEFSVLRATGLSLRQLLALLVTEAVLVMALGLVAGTIIGYGMARVMVPYLSQALSESLSGVTIDEILVQWPAIAQLYLLLLAFYGLALLLLLLVLLRTGVHQALRIGDE